MGQEVVVLFNVLAVFMLLALVGLVVVVVVLLYRLDKLTQTNLVLLTELDKRREKENLNRNLNEFRRSALRKMGVKDEKLLNRSVDFLVDK